MIRSSSPDTFFGNLSGDFDRRIGSGDVPLLRPLAIRAVPSAPVLHTFPEFKDQTIYPRAGGRSVMLGSITSLSSGSPPDSMKYSLAPKQSSLTKDGMSKLETGAEYSPGLTEDMSQDEGHAAYSSASYGVRSISGPEYNTDEVLEEIRQCLTQQENKNQLVVPEHEPLYAALKEEAPSPKRADSKNLRDLFAKPMSGENTFGTRFRRENKKGSPCKDESEYSDISANFESEDELIFRLSLDEPKDIARTTNNQLSDIKLLPRLKVNTLKTTSKFGNLSPITESPPSANRKNSLLTQPSPLSATSPKVSAQKTVEADISNEGDYATMLRRYLAYK